ncbi:PBAN-type neuropeptides-like [Prorops nasuta]|uniref:PBAN-type neuropeptides-like n=1 Tax=Prorops nasuta TaxID=863751 RepID=UPI0034CFD3C2
MIDLSNFTFLVLLLLFVSRAAGEYDNREASRGVSGERSEAGDFRPCIDGKCIKRTTQEVTSGMWFGPRLGRRRRSGVKPEIDPEIEAIANVLDGARWALISIPAEATASGDKRQTTTFTPRLGRESGEDFLYANSRDQDDFLDDDQGVPPLFAPRLGRRLPFAPSPRLGRQLRALFRKI